MSLPVVGDVTEHEPAQLSRRQAGGSASDYNAAAGDNTASPYSSKFKAGQSTMYTSQGQGKFNKQVQGWSVDREHQPRSGLVK